MSHIVTWSLQLTLRKQEYESFRNFAADIIYDTKTRIPNIPSCEWFLSPDRRVCHINGTYMDSDTKCPNLRKITESFVERLSSCVESAHLILYGAPPQAVRYLQSSLDISYMSDFGGFKRINGIHEQSINDSNRSHGTTRFHLVREYSGSDNDAEITGHDGISMVS